MSTRERLRFESWVRNRAENYVEKDLIDEFLQGRYCIDDEYMYYNNSTQAQWQAWQASLSYSKELNNDKQINKYFEEQENGETT